MTNGDKIRQMSNEELAEWLGKNFESDIPCKVCIKQNYCCDYKCEEGIKAYLDMEVQE